MRRVLAGKKSGFTLIEMSIVLIIIGLLVAGILIGQDLIKGAEARAQISQIQKYQAAVHTFQTKYNNFLPGDIPAPYATMFGFQTRGPYAGQGDGNGIIEGNQSNTSTSNYGYITEQGETAMFWADIATANLIEGKFSGTPYWPGTITGSTINSYYPPARIGYGNYIYVTSAGGTASAGQNYFGIAAIYSSDGSANSNPGLTVVQAYNIDKKVDDGLPQSGSVTAMYLHGGSTWQIWAGTNNVAATLPNGNMPGSSTSCFDNGNTSSAATQYSLEINYGTNINCALTFQFQ